MKINGSNNNTGIVYDLISEGPITLVNGLNSIYLNRTPLANTTSDVALLKEKLTGTVTASRTGITFLDNQDSTVLQRGNSDNNKVLVHRGGAQATVSTITAVAGENQSTIVTSTSFFTDAMLTPNGEGSLTEKIRIPGYGLDGADYVGTLFSRASGTSAVVTPKVPKTDGTPTIYFDYYTTASTTKSRAGTIDVYQVGFGDAIPNSALASSTAEISILGSLESNLTAGKDALNFEGVKAAFVPGTRDQAPQSSVPAISAATATTKVGTTLKQHTDFFGAPTKLQNFWGKYKLEYPDGATGGGVVTVNAADLASGDYGAIDELILTLSFPSGLYTSGVEGAYKEQYGAVFQVFFDYSLGGNTKTVQVFGPTASEISQASILVAANTGTFRKGGPTVSGELVSNSETNIDFDLRFSIEQYKPFSNFAIRVKKVTPDRLLYRGGVSNYIADSTVKQVTTIINDKLSYPHSAYAALSFDSNQLNGEFPERAYHCRGVEVSVPTNYVTREEASDGVANYNRNVSTGIIESSYQVWDGNLRRAYTNNPVWNLREILINKRWGLGHWLDPDNINDYSLYSLARYCDQLVPDGKGGLEPRFTCGVYLTQPTEAYKVIKDFCSIMFALPYWVDGQFILEGDRRGEPVYTFTKGNVIDGLFSYEGTGNKTRPNQIVVRFNDRDNFYDQDIELVDDIEDMITKNRIFSQEVVAFGATSRSQAIRYGKWKLLTSKMQKEIVSFRTGENAGFLKPGSIIAVQDADRTAVRNSGRIVSSTTTSVTLDSSVTLASGETHYIYVQVDGAATYLAQDSATISSVAYERGDIIAGITTQTAAETLVDDSGEPVIVQFVPDTHLEKREINETLPFTGSTVDVSTAFTAAPETEFIWAIVSTRDDLLVDGSAKSYKVLGIAEESPGVYAITAAEHYNAKFDILDEDYLSDVPSQVPRYADVPPVTNFTSLLKKTFVSDSAASQTVQIVLRWNSPKNIDQTNFEDFAGYRIKHTDPEGEVETTDISSSATSYSVRTSFAGTHTFVIQAVSGYGPVSKPVQTNIYVGDIATGTVQYKNSVPSGGVISVPVRLETDTLIIPSVYEFTSASGKKVFVGPDTPTDPTEGAIWYNTTTGNQNIGSAGTDPPSWGEEDQEGDTISVEDTTVATSVTVDNVGTTATASITFNTDGTVDLARSHGVTSELDVYDWVIPNNPTKTYHIRATQVSAPTGTGTATGTIGSWLQLNSNRSFGLSDTQSAGSSGSSTSQYTIEISDDGGTTTIDSGTVTFSTTITNVSETITLTGGNIFDWTSDTTSTLTTQLVITNAGLVYANQMSGGTTNFTNWIDPVSAAGSNYEVRFTSTGTGPNTGASTGTWLSLGTTRAWGYQSSGIVSVSGTWQLEVREVATPANTSGVEDFPINITRENLEF